MPALLRKHRVVVPRMAKTLVEPEFAEKVESLLGYQLGAQTAIQQQTLASVLQELEVSVFNPHSRDDESNHFRVPIVKGGARFNGSPRDGNLKPP